MAKDVQRFALPTWRLQHQLPLVFVCLEHQCQLAVFKGNRQTWDLPDQAVTKANTVVGSSRDAAVAQSLAKAELTFMLRANGCPLGYLRQRTVDALGRIGVVKPHLGVRAEDVEKWLRASATFRLVTSNVPGADPNGLRLAVQQLGGRTSASLPMPWSLIWSAVAEHARDGVQWLEQAFTTRPVADQMELDFG